MRPLSALAAQASATGFGALEEHGGPLADRPVHVDALWRRGSKVTEGTPGTNWAMTESEMGAR